MAVAGKVSPTCSGVGNYAWILMQQSAMFSSCRVVPHPIFLKTVWCPVEMLYYTMLSMVIN